MTETTPSAIALSTLDASANPPAEVAVTSSALSSRAEKPDEAAFKAAEAKKRKELLDSQIKTKELEAIFNASKPNNKDSPNSQRQAQLKSELASIRTKQQAHKASRSGVQDKINALDSQLKAKIQDQKNARSRVPFKSVEEIDQRIANLTLQVDSGKMKIVDEKKSLGEISNLNRQKKEFAVFDAKQKDIDVIKEQISETKKGFENPESKALSNEYDIKQAELNALKAEQDAGYKSRDAHKEAFFAAKAKQSSIYQELKQIQDEYYKAKRAADQREREAKRQHFARKKAENEARDLERRRRAMEDELEAAKAPAYLDHIQACNSLIRILDPSSTLSGKASAAISQLAATAQRIVDDSGITGTRLPSKKDDDQDSYFVGGGGKKNRKGKKGRAATAAGDEASSTTSKPVDVGLFYTPGVSEQFEMIGVRPPSSGDDQPRVLEEVKQKKNYYEENQDTKTAENVLAVQQKFERLDAEEKSAAAKTNGHSETAKRSISSPQRTETVEASGDVSKSLVGTNTGGAEPDTVTNPSPENGTSD